MLYIGFTRTCLKSRYSQRETFRCIIQIPRAIKLLGSNFGTRYTTVYGIFFPLSWLHNFIVRKSCNVNCAILSSELPYRQPFYPQSYRIVSHFILRATVSPAILSSELPYLQPFCRCKFFYRAKGMRGKKIVFLCWRKCIFNTFHSVILNWMENK